MNNQSNILLLTINRYTIVVVVVVGVLVLVLEVLVGISIFLKCSKLLHFRSSSNFYHFLSKLRHFFERKDTVCLASILAFSNNRIPNGKISRNVPIQFHCGFYESVRFRWYTLAGSIVAAKIFPLLFITVLILLSPFFPF